MKRLPLAAVPIAAALVLGACGSSGSDASSDDGSTTATTAAPAPELTGPPIHLMTIAGDSFPEAFDGAHAAVDALNASGGVNGSPLELEDCHAADESESVRCARQAVEQEVTAVVGAFTPNGAIVPILEEAGIPIVAPQVVALEYMTSPVSFPLQGGAVAMAGLPLALVEADAPKVGVTGTEGFESSAIVDQVITTGITASGATKVGSTVYVPFNAPDMSAQVAEVTSGDVEGVALPLLSNDIAKFLVTAKQLGTDVTFAAPSASVGPSVLDELGSTADGLLLVGSFPPATSESEGMEQFRSDMETYASDAAVDEISLNAWLGVQIVAEMAADVPTVDAASLLAALNSAPTIETMGILPPLTFATPGSVPGMTRLANSKVFLSKVVDGEAELTAPDPVDPFNP